MLRRIRVDSVTLNSASTLDVELGMVHYEPLIWVPLCPNIRYNGSISLNSVMMW